MKHLFKITLFLSIILLSFIQPTRKVKVLFFGDSITQAGVEPDGYIVKMDSIIKQSHLSDSIELVGAGIGGNKVYDLYLRMEDDVMNILLSSKKLTLCILQDKYLHKTVNLLYMDLTNYYVERENQ